MSLINPGFGLIIWMTIALLVVLFVLKKYAWKPIMEALKEREEGIDNSLRAAEKAHEEMKNLKLDNEQLLKEAKEERDAILREGRLVRKPQILLKAPKKELNMRKKLQ